jgi:hypothetical protein
VKFRKRPVVIDAFPWSGSNHDSMQAWLASLPDRAEDSEPCTVTVDPASSVLAVHTIEGVMTASPGDWIIRGVKGELYPCKPDIFTATYEDA